ncbi:hypothetical protein [Ideonella paludis]|uniref:hypothetical protein n=1 Tax=Ideonella paludis TaxID=1233411 RepID=UPI00362AECC9
MDEQTKTALSYATEVVKHLLTLSTGVIALTIIFTKDFNAKPTNAQVWSMKSSWGLLLASIVFGLATMMALAGTIAKNPLFRHRVFMRIM